MGFDIPCKLSHGLLRIFSNKLSPKENQGLIFFCKLSHCQIVFSGKTFSKCLLKTFPACKVLNYKYICFVHVNFFLAKQEKKKKKKKKKTRRKKSKTKIREHTFRTKLRVERPLNDKKVSPKIRTHTHTKKKKKIILMTEKRESPCNSFCFRSVWP